MKRKNLIMPLLMALAIGIVAAGCCHCRCGKKGHEGKEIALASVPQAVKDAATKSVDGITLTKAESETKDSKTIYEFKGTAKDKKYEIKVDSDGKVLKAKENDEDEDDD